MPTGASPARRLGERVSAGFQADLNSSHGDDHSTSRRGGSGHWIAVSGMVATSTIISDYVSGGLVSSSVPEGGVLFSPDFRFFWFFLLRAAEFSRGCFEKRYVYQVVPPTPPSPGLLESLI